MSKNKIWVFKYFNSIPTSINANTAKGSTARVLLNGWFWPTPNLNIITERSLAIVMSIPKRNRGSTCTSTDTTHDILPLVLTGIDTWDFTLGFNISNEWVDIVTVWTVRVTIPWTSWRRIIFHVNPDHSVSTIRRVNIILSSPLEEVLTV